MYSVDIFIGFLLPTKVSWKTVEKDGYIKKNFADFLKYVFFLFF